MSDEAGVRYRDVLAHRELRGLLAAQVLSEIGDAIARVALAALVLARTHSAALSATTLAIGFLPSLFGAVLGTVADRFARRAMLLGCDGARAVLVAALALAAASASPVWLLLALLLAAEVFSPAYLAASQAVLPDLLPDARQYHLAVGLSRTVNQLDQILGLAVAGAVVTLLGSARGLAIDAASFAVSLVLIGLTMRARPRPAREPGSSFRQELRAGVGVVFRNPPRRGLVLLAWSAAVFTVAPESVALPYARSHGHSTLWGSVLLAAVPAGLGIGSVWLARRAPLQQVRLVVPLAFAACLTVMLTAFDPVVVLALGLWFVAGLFLAFIVPVISTVNVLTPPELRGRVNGVAGAGFTGMQGLTMIGVGWLADVYSPAVAVTVAGAVGLAVLALVARRWPTALLERATRQAYRASA